MSRHPIRLFSVFFIILFSSIYNLLIYFPGNSYSNNLDLCQTEVTDTLSASQDSAKNLAPTDISADSTASDSLKSKAQPIPPFVFYQDSSDFFSFELNRQEFDLLLFRQAADLAKDIPGVELHDLVSTGLPAYLRVQGSSLEQTTIFMDDFPLNHPQFGPLDLSLIPTQAYEKLTTRFNGTRNGFNSPGAVINYTSRDYDLSRQYSEVIWHNGTYDDSEVDVTYGQKITAESELLAGLCIKSTAGRFPHSKFENQKIRTQIHSRIHPNWHIRYQVFHNRSNTDYPGPAYWQPNQANLYAHQKAVFFNHFLKANADISGDFKEDLEIKLYYNSLHQEHQNQAYNLNEIYRNRFCGTHLETYLPFLSRTFTVGSRYEYRWMRSNAVKNSAFHDGTFFLSQGFSPHRLLDFKMTLRLESNSKFGLNFSRYLAFKSEPTPTTKVELAYSASRRLPNFFELFWHPELTDASLADSITATQSTILYLGEKNLDPENIYNITLNLDFQPSFWLKYKSSIFFRRVNQFITMQSDPEANRVSFINSDFANFYGQSQQIGIQIRQNLMIDLNLNLLIAKDERGKTLPERPLFTGSGHLSYRHNFFEGNLKSKFRITFRLLGERWNQTGGFYPFPAYYYSDYLQKFGWEPTIDFKAFLNIRDLDLFFIFENILNRKYFYLDGYQMRESNLNEFKINWGITWRFWK